MSEAEEKLAHLVEQEKALEQSFLLSVGENNKFKEFLLKVQCTQYNTYVLQASF